jgi:hypothetical protein
VQSTSILDKTERLALVIGFPVLALLGCLACDDGVCVGYICFGETGNGAEDPPSQCDETDPEPGCYWDVYTRRSEGVSLWVVRSADIAASDPDDREALFDPAADKSFRQPTDYELPPEVAHM